MTFRQPPPRRGVPGARVSELAQEACGWRTPFSYGWCRRPRMLVEDGGLIEEGFAALVQAGELSSRDDAVRGRGRQRMEWRRSCLESMGLLGSMGLWESARRLVAGCGWGSAAGLAPRRWRRS